VFTVTDLVKEIQGVRSVVAWDVDSGDGEIQEAELSFWAQDDDGNVWNLGEYPEEYDAGVFTGAPLTWISGLQRARAGIHMFAEPKVGTPPYSQGIGPAVDFHDCAQVVQKGRHVEVPFGRYNDVLVTREWDPSQPGTQLKYHAPGVGIVQVAAENDPEGETLVLTNRKQLDPRALADARRETMKLDKRGRRTNDLYRRTEPVEPRWDR
jgi:hypothetical protein